MSRTRCANLCRRRSATWRAIQDGIGGWFVLLAFLLCDSSQRFACKVLLPLAFVYIAAGLLRRQFEIDAEAIRLSQLADTAGSDEI